MMGSPKSEPGHQEREQQHQVTLTRPFYLQTTEVTLEQWHKVMGKRWLAAQRPGGPKSPVTQVSWFQAEQFIYKLNHSGKASYRLPTEAEWEYAARAGSQTSYPWGEGIDCDRAMYANNSLKYDGCQKYYLSRGLSADDPAPVGSFPPNAWGIYDTAGNVWEWVSDWLGPYPQGPATDPQGPVSGEWRVRRGAVGSASPTTCARPTATSPARPPSTTPWASAWSRRYLSPSVAAARSAPQGPARRAQPCCGWPPWRPPLTLSAPHVKMGTSSLMEYGP